MFTFELSQPVWFSLVLDMRLMCMSDVPPVYIQTTDKNGTLLVFAHADKNGVLRDVNLDAVRVLKPDVFVCCYPRQAKRLYPDLPIIGNWDVKTHTHGSGIDCLLHVEEDTCET